MADPSTCPPLTPASVIEAHAKIAPYIHRTPLLTSATLDEIASSPDPWAYLSANPPKPTTNASTTTSNGSNVTSPNGSSTRPPQFRLYFKAENTQKIGAFKARGAFHALTHLLSPSPSPSSAAAPAPETPETTTPNPATIRANGVCTHSSGNHAQALALAAHTFNVPSYIVMPSISTPSKIAGTRRYATEVVFSGSTSVEREAKVAEVIAEKGCVLVPPYDHPDIILGQGTVGVEMAQQLRELRRRVSEDEGNGKSDFDLILAPLGGGGLLSGLATFFANTPQTRVIGCEPSFQGANDAQRGLAEGKRIESVKSLTIADGLRTPLGKINWGVVSDQKKVEAVYSVGEEEIKAAMRLVWERMKAVVEPSGCVALAVVLFCREFREWVAEVQRREVAEGGEGVWDVGVVFSGGNTTMEAVAGLFGEVGEVRREREEGLLGRDGGRVAENVAG
jgi:threonine dehydratase